MNRELWHKRLLYVRDRLCLYPAPEPLPRTRKFWLVMGLITVAALCFCIFYTAYMWARQNGFQTNAEDFGIMDQAIWNTTHGHMLHQTICNILDDTNCASQTGITRFAIHFEPLLFPISLLYFIWSDPKFLLLLQTVIVAIGAYPAFWLARLRLRNEWLAGVMALLYLLYPAQLQATTSDFHVVTFTAALLLFTLYFLYTRQTLWLFVFAILSMACKENIPIVVATFALWSIFFQRRWRSGLTLAVLGIVWFVVATSVIMPHFSPTGHALLSGRYYAPDGSSSIVTYALAHPINFLKIYVFDSGHIAYLHSLFAPTGYIPKPHGGGLFYGVFFAPWILVLAGPSIAINLLSSNPQQYTGLFHYNAEIVPVLIFATIESLVVVRWLARVGLTVLVRRGARGTTLITTGETSSGRWARRQQEAPFVLICILMVGIIFSTLRTDYYFHGQLPFSIGFKWPEVSAHTALAQRFIAMIPPTASVSAQTKLVPHLSQRQSIYLFPYADRLADYVFLDVTGDIYPYVDLPKYTESPSYRYTREVKSVLASGQYGVVAAQDGYLLLKKGVAAPHILPTSAVATTAPVDASSLLFDLPESFCSNIYVSQSDVKHPLAVDFKGSDNSSMHLAGFEIGASSPFSRTNGYGTLSTYWRVDKPGHIPFQLLLFLRGSDGHEYLTSTDMPALTWCPTQTWKAGSFVRLTSHTFSIQKSGIPNGLAQMSIALLPQGQSSSTIMDVQARLPLQVLDASGTVTVSERTNALQLMPINIVD